MTEIITTLELLRPLLNRCEFRKLALIIEAMLAMTGCVTMLGISRWAEEGCSYRTVQRFFNAPHDWSKLRWALIKQHFGEKPPAEQASGAVLLLGDEVVVTKSGKQTHGLGRFFSSIQNQPVDGLCFLNLSLLDVDTRHSYPLITEPLIREEVKGTAPKATKPKGEKVKAGRPTGSKNKDRTVVELTPFQSQLQGCIRQAQALSGRDLKLCYFVYDGALGNNSGLQLVRQTGMHLISKLRHDSELYLPYTGKYAGRGKPKKYGDKVTLAKLDKETACLERVENNIRTRVYQIQAWHKKIPEQLNVVVIVKTNLATGSQSKVLLFSDDLDLAYDKLILYYQLRFQIEFNFRDAKQYWGLEDFMNTQEIPVSNAANLALFMVTFSQLLMPKIKGLASESVLDLKTVFRARKYTRRIINSLGITSDEFLMDDRIFQAAEIGRIHKKAA
jgi:putative transposase